MGAQAIEWLFPNTPSDESVCRRWFRMLRWWYKYKIWAILWKQPVKTFNNIFVETFPDNFGFWIKVENLWFLISVQNGIAWSFGGFNGFRLLEIGAVWTFFSLPESEFLNYFVSALLDLLVFWILWRFEKCWYTLLQTPVTVKCMRCLKLDGNIWLLVILPILRYENISKIEHLDKMVCQIGN